MNILYPFIGDTIGGSHISAITIINALKKKKIFPTVVITQKGGDLEKLLKYNKIKFSYLRIENFKLDRNIFKKLFIILKNFKKVKKFLIKKKIDIIHCNDLRNNFTWSVWSYFSNIKMVWHQRTPWTKSLQVLFFINFCSIIICNSNFVKKGYNFFVKKKIVTVLNIFKKKFLNKKKKKKKYFLIGSFSNIQKVKRPDLLIKLAIYLKKINFKFKIVNYGEDKKKYLFNKIKENNLTDVFLVKNFTRQIYKKINNCDLVLAMSDNDAFGRTIVEAMSVSVPVVASNAGGHKEIIKNNFNGMLFAKGNYKDCSKKVLKTLKSSKLRKKIINNALETIKKYNEEIIIRQLIKIYKSLLYEKKNITSSS